MQKTGLFSMLAASLAFGVTTAQAQTLTEIFSADFTADESSNFTTLVWDNGNAGSETDLGTSDYAVNWVVDSTGEAPTAPNSGDTSTAVVQMQVNFAEPAATAGINILPILPSPYDSGIVSEDWHLQFDMYLSFGGGGTTQFATYGGSDGSVATWSSVGVTDGTTGTPNGFAIGNTGDGGAASDYVYYDGCPTCPGDDGTPPAVYNYKPEQPAWWGTVPGNDPSTVPINGSNEQWSGFFTGPPDGISGVAGVPNELWTTVEIFRYTDETDADSIRVYFTPEGGNRTQVASFDVSSELIVTDNPFVGYFDVFSSVTSAPAETYVYYDNLVVSIVEPPTEASNWSLYQ